MHAYTGTIGLQAGEQVSTTCLTLNWDAFYSELPYTLLALVVSLVVCFVVVDWIARKLDAVRRRIEGIPQKPE